MYRSAIKQVQDNIRQHPWMPLLFLLSWGMIIHKAWTIPMTHDEVGTATYYGLMSIRDIVTYTDPWPNNHILNTLCIKLSMAIWGIKSWAIRLPNVLSFLVYFTFCWMLTGRISHSGWVRAAGMFLCIANPFLLDFFSLARGYAMSVALQSASLYWFARYTEHSKTSFLTGAVIAAALGVYANFTLLNYYMPLIGILGLTILIPWKPENASTYKNIRVLGITTLLLAAVSYLPITKMVATSQFVYWGNYSFYVDTVMSLIFSTRHNITYFGWKFPFFAKVVTWTIIGCISLAAVLNKSWQKWNLTTASVCLLALSFVYNILQHHLADVPYLNARTSLFFIPMLAIPITSLFELLRLRASAFGMIISIMCIGILGYHYQKAYNPKCSFEWYYDENTYELLDDIREIVSASGMNQPVKINCNWLFHPSLLFHTTYENQGKFNLVPYHKETQPESDALFYYAQPEERDILSARYEVVKTYNYKTRFLMMLKPGYR